MKYLLLIMTPPVDASGPIQPVAGCDAPTMDEFIDYTKAIADAGIVVDSQALGLESVRSVQVRGGGERVVTDGPFAEAREIVGGYYLIDVPDLDTALDWAARCPGARGGSVQVREVWEPPTGS